MLDTDEFGQSPEKQPDMEIVSKPIRSKEYSTHKRRDSDFQTNKEILRSYNPKIKSGVSSFRKKLLKKRQAVRRKSSNVS